MAHIFENELGTELYERMLDLSSDLRKNEDELKSFNKKDISIISRVYEKYKKTKISVQFLYAFLSFYFLLNPKTRNSIDVTKNHGYFEIVVDDYDSRGIL